MILTLLTDINKKKVQESLNLTEEYSEMTFSQFKENLINWLTKKGFETSNEVAKKAFFQSLQSNLESVLEFDDNGNKILIDDNVIIPKVFIDKYVKDDSRWERYFKTTGYSADKDLKFSTFLAQEKKQERAERDKQEQIDKEERKRARRTGDGSIKQSYKGDINQLIDWLHANIDQINVYIPVVQEDDDIIYAFGEKNSDMFLSELKEKIIEATEDYVEELTKAGKASSDFKIEEKPKQKYSTWVARLKPEAKQNILPEIKSWMYSKKKSGVEIKQEVSNGAVATDIQPYEDNSVYREVTNVLTGNPIIKDLVFNYDFKLGKQN